MDDSWPPSYSTEDVHGGESSAQPAPESTNSKKRKERQQPRQLLSCRQCRQRKVKCDRTKPCSACCARGLPQECQFIVAEGAEYEPIQQSYEIRKLRLENLRLKERLRAGKVGFSDDDDEDDDDTLATPGTPRAKASTGVSRKSSQQKRFKGNEPSDNLYFGSPALASVVQEFANLNVSSQSLTHTMPRGADIYAVHGTPAFPFATMWPATPEESVPTLLTVLPPSDELYRYLDAFQRRGPGMAFPHGPNALSKKEVERFLSEPQKNASMYPDMLALLFATLAQGSQNSAFDKGGGRWKKDIIEQEQRKGDVYLAAAAHSLRMASFMNRPTLLAIQTLVTLSPYMTNSGRFLDAWTLFGSTIRLAQSMGLHRNPKVLDPVPTPDECYARQSLWWWILHVDQQFSMTLGRPLGASGIGDCPPPEPLTTNTTVLRLGTYVSQFTILARQILSSDRLTNTRIDEFTDRLRGLWDTMPETMQFDESWCNEEKELPEAPLDLVAAVFYGKVHTYLILLNRQRIENSNKRDSRQASISTQGSGMVGEPLNQASTFSPINQNPSATHNLLVSALPGPSRGREAVLASCKALITAISYWHLRIPFALLCWTMGQQAFNAGLILTLDAFETLSAENLPRIEHLHTIFKEMQEQGVHKLADLAVEYLSWGVYKIKMRCVEGGGGGGSSGMKMTVGEGVGIPPSPIFADRSGRRDPHHHGQQPHPPRPRKSRPFQYPEFCERVMDNTGMFLLEDPGLLASSPESFSPLNWVMGGKDFPDQKPGKSDGKDLTGVGASGHKSSHPPSQSISPTLEAESRPMGPPGSRPGTRPSTRPTSPTAANSPGRSIENLRFHPYARQQAGVAEPHPLAGPMALGGLQRLREPGGERRTSSAAASSVSGGAEMDIDVEEEGVLQQQQQQGQGRQGRRGPPTSRA
ncbi:hypothetical protein K402DRAFT_417802 [Aulographum hederae CBS 113979]|uniref:Zn(2)-C6 fungal-type domain-containing protein n=1 Tax=Aulographum hederae CBS 113979 TaxID=1176131 RepID=A0A6G1HAV3_9PEZI|nr:hypothetical protein K402DRAFT_417802 [Aulographum hederae CBS 113979]